MASQTIISCSRLLADRGLTIAFAESATAGRLSAEFAMVPDSGKILLGGIVCYDACVKQELFGISADTIKKYTAESAQVTRELAENLHKYFKCDVTVAITGLVAPGGSETPEKPVGSMFTHILFPERVYSSHREVFKGTPEEIIAQTIHKVGIYLLDMLE